MAMSAFAKLRESDFSTTEKRIADYILKNADRLPEISISTIARECETSKSMVVQLCKTAGFKGYKDLCSQLLVEKALSGQKEADNAAYDEIHPDCTVTQIAQITLREELRSLQDTADLMDPEAIEEAVRLLMQADRIMLFGVGGSAVAALDMYNKLCRVGFNVSFSQDVHCQLLESTALTERSVVLVFSFSGRTKDMIEACELSREMGAKVISVTRYGRNPISELSDVCLSVASNESLRRVTAMSSRLSTMCMVDVLFTCLVSRMGGRIDAMIRRNTMIANRRRK